MNNTNYSVEFENILDVEAIDMKKYDELLVSLRKMIRSIDLYSKKLSKETGLTSPQLILLQQIAARDGILVKQIADNINLSSATVTNILDRLESRDFVVRERSTVDKRKVGLHITEQGMQAISKSPMPLQRNFINQFEELADEEQVQMLATLRRLAKMMDSAAIPTQN